MMAVFTKLLFMSCHVMLLVVVLSMIFLVWSICCAKASSATLPISSSSPYMVLKKAPLSKNAKYMYTASVLSSVAHIYVYSRYENAGRYPILSLQAFLRNFIAMPPAMKGDATYSIMQSVRRACLLFRQTTADTLCSRLLPILCRCALRSGESSFLFLRSLLYL